MEYNFIFFVKKETPVRSTQPELPLWIQLFLLTCRYASFMPINFVSIISRTAYLTPSLPTPLSFTPPYG